MIARATGSGIIRVEIGARTCAVSLRLNADALGHHRRMRMVPLQSGSAGNCVLVEAAGVRLLVDAGLSAVRTAERLRAIGVDPASIDAVLISHDHADHVAAAGIIARRWGIPVHLTEPTWAAIRTRYGETTPWARFQAGSAVRIGAVTVETIATPHDAADGVVFVVDDGRHRLGILTDFGQVSAWLPGVVESLDAVYLESNYDHAMLMDGPYPAALKHRISGRGGHISNEASAGLIAGHGQRLRWACLAHLSATNNHPNLVLATHRRAYGDQLPLAVARRDAASAELRLA